jgi:hypothetical protein
MRLLWRALQAEGESPLRVAIEFGQALAERMKLNNSAFPYLVQCSEFLQHVPTAMNRDSQDTPEVRV